MQNNRNIDFLKDPLGYTYYFKVVAISALSRISPASPEKMYINEAKQEETEQTRRNKPVY